MPLIRYFEELGVERVNIFTDPEGEAIALHATRRNDAFVLRRTSNRCGALSANLREVMEQGKYVVQPEESTPRKLVFRKEYITYHYGKPPTESLPKASRKESHE
jgi:hypothetical protein